MGGFLGKAETRMSANATFTHSWAVFAASFLILLSHHAFMGP